MIDAMFQAGTDAALADLVQRPKPEAPPKPLGLFSGFMSSPFQGIGGGVAESIGFGAELVGAFGSVLGAYPEAMGLPLTAEQKKQGEEARRKLLAFGPEPSNEAGDLFRQRAKDIMPDPLTTGAAAQVTGGLFNFVTKAVGYGLTMGPGGPLMLGGDVGMTESDRLKQQGVDTATRTKAGAIAGAVAAVSVVVPMTGATAAIRAAKGIAVGEGSLMGQSLAEKAILKAAGYDKIADTFDPLDPVSLAIGLVPGALGAKFGGPAAKASPTGVKPILEMGLPERQALKYDDIRLDAYAVQAAQREGIPPEVLLAVKNAGEKSGSNATSPKGAQGVMQFMPSTFKEFGRGDATDPINSIDAGAKYLKKLHDAYGDWDAAIAHYNGGGSQAAIVRGGGKPSFPETAKYLERVKAYLGKSLDEHVAAAVKENPDLVPAARVSQAAAAIDSSRLTQDSDIAGRNAHIEAVETAADQIGRGEPVSVAHLVGEGIDREANFRQWFGESKVRDEAGAPLVMYRGAKATNENIEAPAWFTTSTDTANTYAGVRNPVTGELVTADRVKEGAQVQPAFLSVANPKEMKFAEIANANAATIQRVRAEGHDGMIYQNPKTGEKWVVPLDAAQVKSAIGNSGRFDPHSASLTDPLPAFAKGIDALRAAREPQAPPRAAAASKAVEPAAGEKPAPAPPRAAAEGTGKPEAIAQATIDRAAAEVSALHPDLMVQMDGMDKPVRVADLLERVKEEAAHDATDAKLIEAAVSCALQH